MLINVIDFPTVSLQCYVVTVLSREENAMGRLLKTGSEIDKTRAGKMMAAVAKAQNYSSQQLYDQTFC